jgi:hypothetical protein
MFYFDEKIKNKKMTKEILTLNIKTKHSSVLIDNDIENNLLEAWGSNSSIVAKIVGAYNETIDKKKTKIFKVKDLCDIFIQKLSNNVQGNTDTDIAKGFLALYRHYGSNLISDNLQGIGSKINKNDKLRHCIKSMFCCCFKNYRSRLDLKKDFQQFISSCREVPQTTQVEDKRNERLITFHPYKLSDPSVGNTLS